MLPDADPRLRLLLLDEHDRARQALVRRLEGHQQIAVVGDTPDPMHAHEIVAATAPHIVLIDASREDGLWPRALASLAALPAERRPLLIVHLAFFDPDVWERAHRFGADTLILKSIGASVLCASLLDAAARLLPPERRPAVLSGLPARR